MHTQRTFVLAILSSTLVLLAGRAVGAAQTGTEPVPAAGFDEATGRVARSYPPHLDADFKHMKLEITIPDMNVPKLTATQTLTLAPISGPLASLTLDAKAMAVTSVTSPGRKVGYEHDGKRLTINLDPPADPGVDVQVVTAYDLNDPPLGLVWTPESPAWPGRAAQIHTQGQPQTNSYWFPCHDFPNDRLTTEVVVTLPAGYTVSSNGRLVERSKGVVASDVEGVKALAPYETWHWLQDKPHVPYLVSMVVGKFDIVDLGTKALPMPVYVPPGRGGDVKATYGNTPKMIEFFGKKLDEPYPWDRYAQLVVWNFGAGGMENTSATTMYDSAIFSADALNDNDLDGLISHELGHQWFGDLVTCNSWEHIWLNEGFATYMTALWMEQRDGQAAYQRNIRGNYDGLCAADKAEAPAKVGMVSKVYTHPWEAFRREANPYGKGSSVLHMLRRRLGDEIFFKGIARYIDEHKFTTVQTMDLRQTLESVSGLGLEQFFAQWCDRPGVPKLTVKPEWDAASGILTVAVDQTQPINGDNPAFEFDLPVLVQVAGEKSPVSLVVPVRGKLASATATLTGEPEMVAVDPNLDVLADIDVQQPAERWLKQLAGGPTPWSRVQAVRGLSSDNSVKNADLLRRLVQDPKQPTWLRLEAVKSLSKRRDENDLRSLATTVTDQWEVRQAIVDVLPQLAKDEKGEHTPGYDGVTRLLADRAGRDSSSKIRSSAIRALGDLKSEEYVGLVTGALKLDSQDDAVRQAALGALASYDQKEMLALAMEYAGPGHNTRTRAVAAGTVGSLAHYNPDDAYKFLVALLYDRELRVQQAAGNALVATKDQRAAAEFEKLAAATRSEEMAWQIGQWIKKLQESKK